MHIKLTIYWLRVALWNSGESVRRLKRLYGLAKLYCSAMSGLNKMKWTKCNQDHTANLYWIIYYNNIIDCRRWCYPALWKNVGGGGVLHGRLLDAGGVRGQPVAIIDKRYTCFIMSREPSGTIQPTYCEQKGDTKRHSIHLNVSPFWAQRPLWSVWPIKKARAAAHREQTVSPPTDWMRTNGDAHAH